jgi:tetratricopeptide (TPR) repeat protein
MSHDVFICYSSVDEDVANTVCSGLEAAGVKCWIAPRNILPGQTWPAAIAEAIPRSRATVLIFSLDSSKSDDVISELVQAKESKIPIVPFKIEDVPAEGAIKYLIAGLGLIEASNPPTKKQIDNLIEAVKAALEPVSEQSGETEIRTKPSPTVGRAKRIPIWVYVVAIILLLLVVAGTSYILIWSDKEPDRERALKYYQAADAFLKKYQWKEAVDQYDLALRLDPNYADAYVGRASALLNSGQSKQALADGKKAVDLAPTNPTGYAVLGGAYALNGESNEALNVVNKGLKIDSTFTGLYFVRAHIYALRGDTWEAIADLKKCLELDPNYEDAKAALKALGVSEY